MNIDEHLNSVTSMKRVFDNLVIICEGDLVNILTNYFNKRGTYEMDIISFTLFY